jgi:uncharacterized protein (TIGR02118 family)
MIKFFGLIPRRAGISPQEFHDHYRHPHGTLGRMIPTFRAYVQSHQIESVLLGPDQRRFEAVAEVWFDTAADAVGLANDPHYLKYVQPDEPNFVDLENLKWLYVNEEVLVSGPEATGELAEVGLQGFHVERATSVKLMQFIEGEPTFPRTADEDRALGRRLGAARHVRSRPHADIHVSEPPAYSGVQELWWPTVSAFEEGAAANEALAEFLAPSGTITLLAQAERFT